MAQTNFEALGLKFNAGDLSGEPVITGLSVDSRDTKSGHLFIALPGVNVHGGKFIKYALRMGASAVLTDQEGYDIAVEEIGAIPVPVMIAKEPRAVLSLVAANWFKEQPGSIVAVTGTNGKTSVASFTRQIWEELGVEAVNFGTAGVEGAVKAPLSHTTPEPIKLHKLLAELAGEGVTHAAMEASSHGLEQHRLDGVKLVAGGFTNFSQDHLDYHETFDAYFAAKMGLFTRVLPKGAKAVIHIDDKKGAEVLSIAQAAGLLPLTVGTPENADIRLLNQRFDPKGQVILISYDGQSYEIRLDLIGGFQAQNVLVAAGLVIGSGFEAPRVFEALKSLKTVRGRMELAATRKNGAAIYVDYAHTPDALETALKAMRPHVSGRLLVIIGAGGDRDKTKRPLMGKAAAEFADVVYVTDDNPRTEEPASIRKMVLEGCPQANEIGDRAEAILAATDALQSGDTLLIAGKGHETGQIVGQDILPFNDSEMASIAVRALEEAR